LKQRRAVLLDRDGTLTEMVYYPEHGFADSPFVPSQVRLIPGVGEALRKFKKMGYKLIVVSNQPGIAKKHFTMKTFGQMRKRMNELLANEGVVLDAEYYCFHHPQATLTKYRKTCDCRKPESGLLIRASEEHNVSLKDSFMVGDGLSDVVAGNRAGSRTILLGSLNSFVSRLISENGAEPDYVARNIGEAADTVKRLG